MGTNISAAMREQFCRDPDLPALPQNVIRVLALLEDAEVSFNELAREVQTDPAMALCVLRLANSPLYGQAREVTSLERAFSVIGLGQLSGLLAGFASVGRCEQFLNDPDFQWGDYWRHCSGTGFIASSLAQRLGLQFRGAQFPAGLLHDLGYLAMAKFDRFRFRRCVQAALQGAEVLPTLLAEAYGIAPHHAGALLAEASNLAPDICRSIRFAGHPEQAPEAVRPLTSVVSLASALAHLLGLTFFRGPANIEVVITDLPAWQVLQQVRPAMASWDVARLLFELEREYAASEVFVQETHRQDGGT